MSATAAAVARCSPAPAAGPPVGVRLTPAPRPLSPDLLQTERRCSSPPNIISRQVTVPGPPRSLLELLGVHSQAEVAAPALDRRRALLEALASAFTEVIAGRAIGFPLASPPRPPATALGGQIATAFTCPGAGLESEAGRRSSPRLTPSTGLPSASSAPSRPSRGDRPRPLALMDGTPTLTACAPPPPPLSTMLLDHGAFPGAAILGRRRAGRQPKPGERCGAGARLFPQIRRASAKPRPTPECGWASSPSPPHARAKWEIITDFRAGGAGRGRRLPRCTTRPTAR